MVVAALGEQASKTEVKSKEAGESKSDLATLSFFDKLFNIRDECRLFNGLNRTGGWQKY